jgi:hypothetical protein
MSHWIPKGAPVGDVSRVDQYSDGELTLCLEHAEKRIAALSKERSQLQEWLRQMLKERDDRVVQRAADHKAARERLAAGPAPVCEHGQQGE